MLKEEIEQIKKNEKPEIIQKVFDYYEKEYGPISDKWMSLPWDALSSIREKERIALLEKQIGTKVNELTVLNVGSGMGSFDIEMQRYGVDMHGIEPDETEFTIAKERVVDKGLKQNIKKAVGEALPYPEDTFDLITSFQVMEHVQDPGEVIKEMVRVTKPGGMIYINMPNHNSFWEGHYGTFWFPHLWRPLAKMHIKFVLKKDHTFFDTINYLSPKKIKKFMKKHDVLEKVEILSWGSELFEERLDKLNFSDWGHIKRTKNLVKIMQSLKLVGFMKWINRNIYAFYYPMILIMRKK